MIVESTVVRVHQIIKIERGRKAGRTIPNARAAA